MIDKYNVTTKPFKGTKCPECGAPLSNSNVPHCPNCGTSPFEEKNEKEKSSSDTGEAEAD